MTTSAPATPILAQLAAQAAEAKNGSATIVIDVGQVLAITDHFVITSGTNPRQVRAIVDEVEARVRSAGGGRPLRREGLDDARWVLLDYGDFVVHVLLDEARAYYELERLWADAPRLAWESDDGILEGGGELAAAVGLGVQPE